MKVLLLGATGSLGSRILSALLAHNHQVVVYVRNESKLRELIPETVFNRVTIVIGDATNSDAIRDALVENQCDAFINSAGQASIFPWQSPKMQDIINAVVIAGNDASTKLDRPLRCWLLGGLSVLDMPGSSGTKLSTYFPVFTEHGLTYDRLRAQSLGKLQWSMLCPSQMVPVSKTIEPLSAPHGNSLMAENDLPADWQQSYFHNIPILGTFMGILGNITRYNTTLEDNADFLAADLKQSDSRFVGHRVGVISLPKGKRE